MVEQTPSLSSLSDLVSEGDHNGGQSAPMLTCLVQGEEGTCKKPYIVPISFDVDDGDHFDWVFGVRWSPEVFLQQAVLDWTPLQKIFRAFG